MHPNVYIYVCVPVCVTRLYIHFPFSCMCENRSGLCMRAPVCDGDGSAVCACVGGLVLRARPEPETLNRASPCPSASTACGFGAQAFTMATAFNANIGAWNTASMSSLFLVCAAPGPAARTMADALGRASERRGPVVRGGTADARAHPCRHYLARGLGCRYGRAEGRFDTCLQICIYICVCVFVCVTRVHIHDPFICICENRSGLCMRAPVCDGDGSAVCACVGGLVLRARPEPETLNRASPCPSASTACGFGAQAFYITFAFNANIGAWNTARVTDLFAVCAAFSARRRATAGGTRSAGRRCGAGRCARRNRRCVCADVWARACAGVHVCRYSCA
jgi:hypothetical protein